MCSAPRRHLACFAALAGLTCAGTASAAVLENHRVVMRDGVELSTDVWRPDGVVTQRPVVLRRTPYGRALDASSVNGLLFYGYTVVSQDVRGRGDSAGEFMPFLDDRLDGPDTLAWIAAQPFSNGRVGTWSASAEGIVQLMAAGEGPPALRCAHVGVATGDVYEGVMPGGAWRQDLTTNWLADLQEPTSYAALRAHEAGDSFWDPARLTPARRAMVKAPIFLYGGFFDIFAKDTVKTHRLLQQEADPSVRGDMFLIVGPWTHSGTGATVQGEVTFPADAAYQAALSDLAAWLTWCLQDGTRPSWHAVRYYRMRLSDDGRNATGQWLGADAWPPPSTATTLYVHDDASLSARTPRDGIAWKLHSDPAAPIPSRGGGNLTTPAGPMDQTSIDALANVMTATTLPAVEDVTLVGDVTARVWAASSTTDADVVVRLSQVTPGGRSMLLADGVRRGRFVSGFDALRSLTPGLAVAFDVEVGPVSFVLPKGHSVRVSIQTTSSPRYEANPGVATPLSQAPVPVAYDLTVYRDPAHPSSVTLPVVSGTLPTPPGPDAGLLDAALQPSPDAELAPTDDAGHEVSTSDAGGPLSPDGGAALLPDGSMTEGTDSGAVGPTAPTGCGCSSTGGSWPLAFCALTAMALGLTRRSPRRRAP